MTKKVEVEYSFTLEQIEKNMWQAHVRVTKPAGYDYRHMFYAETEAKAKHLIKEQILNRHAFITGGWTGSAKHRRRRKHLENEPDTRQNENVRCIELLVGGTVY